MPPLTPTLPHPLLLLAGSPPSSVSLRNLQTTTSLLPDAWNRPRKLQPLLLSASVWFQHPFPTTSAADALSTTDTVHYGNLAKALLAALPSTGETWIGGLVCDVLFPGLTGEMLSGAGEGGGGKLVDLRGGGVRYLSLTARLPKASLLGSGVSFTLSVAPGAGKYATALAVEGVRVPVLVGVNENERGARQVVEVTVTVEGVDVGGKGGDWFTRLEGVVVDVSDCSFLLSMVCLFGFYADDCRPWKSRRLRRSRRWARVSPRGCCLPSTRGTRRGRMSWMGAAGRFMSAWRSPRLFRWPTARSWRLGPAGRLGSNVSQQIYLGWYLSFGSLFGLPPTSVYLLAPPFLVRRGRRPQNGFHSFLLYVGTSPLVIS